MKEANKSISVLATINATYRAQLDGNTLAEALKTADIKKAQVGSFLMEVSTELQNAFLAERKISKANLQTTAEVYAKWSGH